MQTTPKHTNILEYKPKVPDLPDPYKLIKNDEKRDAFSMLCWIVEHTTDEKVKLVAVQYIKNESYREAKKWAARMRIFEEKEIELSSEAIERYKVELKRKLVTKYMNELISGKLSKEASEEFKKLDMMTLNSCFVVNGADVYPKDCAVCPRKCSTRQEKFNAYGEDEE